MGTWLLEVGKMAIYIAFPVGLFHVFNKPEYFEEYVIKVKQEMYPPDVVAQGEELQRELKAVNQAERLKTFKSLEKK